MLGVLSRGLCSIAPKRSVATSLDDAVRVLSRPLTASIPDPLGVPASTSVVVGFAELRFRTGISARHLYDDIAVARKGEGPT